MRYNIVNLQDNQVNMQDNNIFMRLDYANMRLIYVDMPHDGIVFKHVDIDKMHCSLIISYFDMNISCNLAQLSLLLT